MSSFTESAFIKKLQGLNLSQQSIQTLSLWLIHHRKHHQAIVKIWYKELLKAKDTRKLTFMYLANDVIQNSKKKGPEYTKEFGTILKEAFDHLQKVGYDDKTNDRLNRLLNIWGERHVYDQIQITSFKQALLGTITEPAPKRLKTEKKEVTFNVNGTYETHITLSPHKPSQEPPEPEELIKVLHELDNNSASRDAAIREKLSNLPPEISDVALLSKISDKEQAEKLSKQVNDAVNLLTEYNQRLTTEMECRKRVMAMLKDFLETQQELLAQAEERLKAINKKQKVA